MICLPIEALPSPQPQCYPSALERHSCNECCGSIWVSVTKSTLLPQETSLLLLVVVCMGSWVSEEYSTLTNALLLFQLPFAL